VDNPGTTRRKPGVILQPPYLDAVSLVGHVQPTLNLLADLACRVDECFLHVLRCLRRRLQAAGSKRTSTLPSSVMTRLGCDCSYGPAKEEGEIERRSSACSQYAPHTDARRREGRFNLGPVLVFAMTALPGKSARVRAQMPRPPPC